MIKLELHDFQKMSFPDFNVIDIVFKPDEKYLEIQVDGAWIENELTEGRELGKGKLRFRAWENFEIFQYNQNLDNWVKIQFDDFDPIKDICEVKCLKEQICIQGFGNKSGAWTEYKISSPIVECEFEE